MSEPSHALPLGASAALAALQAALAEADVALAPRRPGGARVHAARKSLKRARSLLRLVKPALSPRRFRRENLALRDAGRALSAQRDADVLAAALRAVAIAARVEAAGVAPLAAALRAERAARRPGGLATARAELRRSRQRLAAFAPRPCGWQPLARGFERIHARGRAAFAAALEEPDADALHELRKQAKHLAHAFEFLQPLWRRPIRALLREARTLGDLLGEDHDLVLLTARIRSAHLDAAICLQLLKAIDARRAELHDRAFAIGARLYDESSSRLRARFEGYRRHPPVETLAAA